MCFDVGLQDLRFTTSSIQHHNILVFSNEEKSYATPNLLPSGLVS